MMYSVDFCDSLTFAPAEPAGQFFYYRQYQTWNSQCIVHIITERQWMYWKKITNLVLGLLFFTVTSIILITRPVLPLLYGLCSYTSPCPPEIFTPAKSDTWMSHNSIIETIIGAKPMFQKILFLLSSYFLFTECHRHIPEQIQRQSQKLPFNIWEIYPD